MQRLIVEPTQIREQILYLTADQRHYLKRVLRLQIGDRFLALNGQGKLWLATLTHVDEQAMLAPLPESSSQAEDSLSEKPWVTLAACLPKQGFDEVVRQVTELGVNQIVPVVSERTLLRPSLNKVTRWRRIAAEAAEQSERLTVPEIGEPMSWTEWLTEDSSTHRCLCVARRVAPSFLAMCLSTNIEQIVIAIGPEGGWTEAEIEQAIAAGYQVVTLGQGILRAVTAAVAAISIFRAGFASANMRSYQLIQSWTP